VAAVTRVGDGSQQKCDDAWVDTSEDVVGGRIQRGIFVREPFLPPTLVSQSGFEPFLPPDVVIWNGFEPFLPPDVVIWNGFEPFCLADGGRWKWFGWVEVKVEVHRRRRRGLGSRVEVVGFFAD
jgi:hypothetical protein